MAENVRLGSVRVDYTANNARFLQAAKKNVGALRLQGQQAKRFQTAVRGLRRDSRALTRSLSRLGGVLGGLSLIGAVAGLSRISQQQAKFGATLREVSIAAGITVENLQLTRRAFEGNGVAVDNTDKALIKLNRTLGEARTLQTYRRQFEALGLNVEELFGILEAGGSIFDILLKVSDGLAGISTQAERVEIAQNLLGRQGGLLLPTLQDGSAAFLEQTESMRRLGLATEAQAIVLKALDQTYTDVGNTIQTSFAVIVAENADLFARVAETVGKIIPRAFLRLTQAIDFVIDNFNALSRVGLILIALKFRVAAITLNLYAATRAAGVFGVALSGVISLGRTLGKVLLVGFIVEGFLIAIDAVIAFTKAIEETGANFFVVFTKPILDSLSLIANTYLSLTDIFRTAVGLGSAGRVDFAELLFGADEVEAAREAGGKFASTFIESARRRFGLASLATVDIPVPTVPGIPGQLTDALPDIGREAGQDSVRFLESTLDLERDISRQLEDTARARERSLELIGLTGRALAIVEARQGVITEFEDKRLRITRELADGAERSGRAALAASRANAEGNEALERAARRVIETLRERQVILQGDLVILDAQIMRIDLLTEAAEREARAQAAVERAVEQSNRAFGETQSSIENASRAVTDFAAQAVTGFNSVGDSVRQLGLSIVNDLTRNLISRPITNFLSQLLGNVFSGGGGGVNPKQHGGLAGSGLTLLGEGGPELVDFRNPGRVYTNEQLAAALAGGGGSTINYAPTINNSDEAAVERALVDFLPTLVDVVKSSLGRDSRRPGPAFG